MNPMWQQALLGGAMIGLAAAALLLVNARIAGISDILANVARGNTDVWRYAFLIGLVASPSWAPLFGLPPVIAHHRLGAVMLVIAGLLVGAGSQLVSGCTSGHGICGLSNLSPRSFTAVAVFMAVAMATVFVTRHLLPPGTLAF